MLNVLVEHPVGASKLFSFVDDWANETGFDAQARFLTGTFGMTASGGTYVFPEKRAHSGGTGRRGRRRSQRGFHAGCVLRS
jgi:hypothetical protein